MKVFTITKYKLLMTLFITIAVCGIFINSSAKYETATVMLPVGAKTIIIDAGHGGWDPGKTGVNGENEKDINLKIAMKLQQYLEQAGAVVFVTRNTDEALDKGKKGDMKGRKEIANNSNADIFISIHQNAFPQKKAKGAQVFYHKSSENGKKLAELIQEELKKNTDSENTRQAKSNTDYYVLKKSEIPAAIVECGFISNPEEEKKLNTDEYQEKLAWSIYLGIMDYFQQQEAPEQNSDT